MPKKFLIFGIIIILIVLALIIFLFFLKTAKKSENRETSEMTQEEQPMTASSTPLASGKQVYSIITAEPRNPQILEVEVDPLDVELGKIQTITVKIQDDESDSISEFDSVSAVIITDNKTIAIPLKLIKAEGQEALLTFWEGLWERDDTIDYNYRLRIEAANIKGENSVEITFK